MKVPYFITAWIEISIYYHISTFNNNVRWLIYASLFSLIISWQVVKRTKIIWPLYVNLKLPGGSTPLRLPCIIFVNYTLVKNRTWDQNDNNPCIDLTCHVRNAWLLLLWSHDPSINMMGNIRLNHYHMLEIRIEIVPQHAS